MTRRTLFYILLVVLALTIAMFLPRFIAFLESDRCMDLGGVWDSRNSRCDENKDQDKMNRCMFKGERWRWDFEARACKEDVRN
jgi:hypothetical protein